jgi:hypothetical protein
MLLPRSCVFQEKLNALIPTQKLITFLVPIRNYLLPYIMTEEQALPSFIHKNIIVLTLRYVQHVANTADYKN